LRELVECETRESLDLVSGGDVAGKGFQGHVSAEEWTMQYIREEVAAVYMGLFGLRLI